MELQGALASLAQGIRDNNGISCTFAAKGKAVQISDTAAMHLYCIAMEACNNASRHAQPRNIAIELRSEDEQLVLEIADDGVGIAATRSDLLKGIGTRIMMRRAEVIGGKLSIESVSPHGTVVTCRLPGSIHAKD